MHIEPGIVDGAKIVLSYATAAAALAATSVAAVATVRKDGVLSLAVRTVTTSALVFSFFQVLPHYPVGVSEVHLILGSTLFLMFGAAPAEFSRTGRRSQSQGRRYDRVHGGERSFRHGRLGQGSRRR